MGAEHQTVPTRGRYSQKVQVNGRYGARIGPLMEVGRREACVGWTWRGNRVTEGSGHLVFKIRECSNLGKVLCLETNKQTYSPKQNKKPGGSWAPPGRKVGWRKGGEPCPSLPSVPSTHPAGKPWGRSYSGGPAQNSFPSGQGCPARSASSRNRAGRRGWQGREGPPQLAGSLSRWDPGTGLECTDQGGAGRRGRDAGSAGRLGGTG